LSDRFFVAACSGTRPCQPRPADLGLLPDTHTHRTDIVILKTNIIIHGGGEVYCPFIGGMVCNSKRQHMRNKPNLAKPSQTLPNLATGVLGQSL